MFAGGLKNGIQRLSNLLGSTFPSDFLNLRFDSVFRKATQLSWLEDVNNDWHSPAKPPDVFENGDNPHGLELR